MIMKATSGKPTIIAAIYGSRLPNWSTRSASPKDGARPGSDETSVDVGAGGGSAGATGGAAATAASAGASIFFCACSGAALSVAAVVGGAANACNRPDNSAPYCGN